MKINFFSVLLVLASYSYVCAIDMNQNQIRVSLSYKMPLDPLKISSMADYDIALLLNRNWFEYDEGRKAVPGIISNWIFDKNKKGYYFHIGKNARWSNGDLITSQDLLDNLKRVLKSNSDFSKSIRKIIDTNIPNPTKNDEFFIGMINGKPSEAFFQRMGSIFLAISSPKDWDSSLNVISSKFSSGPYVVKSYSEKEILLEKNKFYPQISNGADSIIIKNQTKNVDLDAFISGSSWENIVQISSMIPLDLADKIKAKKMTLWSRSHDRVSLFKPLKGKNLLLNRETIKQMWAYQENLSKINLPLDAKRAKSLQPVGYPLFEELSFDVDKKQIRKTINIAATDSITSRFQAKLLADFFNHMHIHANWNFIKKAEFISILVDDVDSQYDIAFFDFGVADPEPATWMSLISNVNFISFTESTKKQLADIIEKNENNEILVTKLKLFLKNAASSGSYFPVFHFSTLSLGYPQLSFEKIRDLDETVNYSKVIFR